MRFDETAIRRLEALAQVALTAAERTQLTADLTAILDYLSDWIALDIPALPDVAPDPGAACLRADEVIPSPSTEAFLAAAPETRDGYIIVPRIYE